MAAPLAASIAVAVMVKTTGLPGGGAADVLTASEKGTVAPFARDTGTPARFRLPVTDAGALLLRVTFRAFRAASPEFSRVSAGALDVPITMLTAGDVALSCRPTTRKLAAAVLTTPPPTPVAET